MIHILKPFLALCAVLFPLFVYGQEDTLNADGLFPKYNKRYYQMSEYPKLPLELKKKWMFGERRFPVSNGYDRVIGLDTAVARIGLTYKRFPQYIISESFCLKSPTVNSDELRCTVDEYITSQWIHEDGECILFIKCGGPVPDKSVDRIFENVYNWIRSKMNVTRIDLREITDEEIDKIKKRITVWPRSKAEEVFNARYVITYPIRSRKSVYMGKYSHKFDMIILKWTSSLTVSFLVTKKGQRHLDQYIEDVKSAFRFED